VKLPAERNGDAVSDGTASADDVNEHALASAVIVAGDVRRHPFGETQQPAIVVDRSGELYADGEPPCFR
jgi:hypothetical protein